MDFAQAVAWILSFANYEVTPLAGAPAARLELQPLRTVLARIGEPQLGRGTVHITGSKGKGSVAAMIAAMLQACGRRAGLYTSPHLHTIRERIRVDGEPVSAGEFAAQATEVRAQVEQGTQSLTTFELLTALAFLCFRAREADWQVVEVGLGGSLDATNVLDEKQLCIFTPIELEHTEVLGDTVAQIAADKAGILRPGVPAVMGLQRESAADVIRAACAGQGSRLIEVAGAARLARARTSLDGQDLQVRTPNGDYRFRLPLLGRFQAENAVTAVLALEQLAEGGVPFTADVPAKAFAGFAWPGRVEVLKRRPLVVVDGAHTADAARRLAETIRDELPHRGLHLIVGMSADKNASTFASAFAAADPTVIATRAGHPRAMNASAVGQAFQDQGMIVRLAPNVAAAVDTALADAGADDLILATGSLFVAAEAREAVLGIMPDLP